MDVKELTQNQLDFLKQKIFYSSDDDLENEYCEVLTDDIIIELEKATIWTDISNETIYTLFSGINFVYDDFGFE